MNRIANEMPKDPLTGDGGADACISGKSLGVFYFKGGDMRKVIDGKLYDTEKAKAVCSWSNGYYGDDFHRCNETLYRTDKGNWFLHGEGGALSIYGKQTGDGSCGGCVLVPFSEDDAFEWLQEKGDVAVLEEYFNARIEEA
jgi:hypothetical protein